MVRFEDASSCCEALRMLMAAKNVCTVIKLRRITSQTVKNSKVLIIINYLSQMTGKFLTERRLTSHWVLGNSIGVKN